MIPLCSQRRAHSLAALALLLALLSACGPAGPASASADDATPTPLPTPVIPERPMYTVELGTVVQTLEFTGRASPVQEQELFFKTNGMVTEVFVARGDWVKAGDVLAELDIDDLQKQLAQKQVSLQTLQLKTEQAQIEAAEAITTALAAVSEAEDKLRTAETTSANDLADARAAIPSAEAQLKNAQLNLTVVQNSDVVSKNVREREYEANWYEVNYGQMLEKYERGEIDKTRLDLEYSNLITAKERLAAARAAAELALSQAQAQVTQAEESLRQAKARLAELLQQPSVSEAQAALTRAQQAYRQAVAGADPESYSMKLLALELAQAQLDVEDLEGQIANARLIAPFAGQILSLDISVGDSVEAYGTVGVLADPAALEITAELSSDELSQMALNQLAKITLRNRPGQTFEGTVRQLPYPYGGTTVDTGDDDTAVHVAISEAVDLALGELATVSIVLQEKQNVLWLPPGAIRTYQGRNFVVVQNQDGSQSRVDVLLGIVTDQRVEVIAGAQEGQVIVGE